MTDDEAAAIQLYTQQCCLYPMLNATLRNHTHPENLTAFLPYLKLLLTALNKLPLVRAKVYRGMRGDFHETYNQLQGQVLRWWAFSSTTAKESQAKSFIGDKGERTFFTIDAIGVDIAAFSAFPLEREVLLLPGTCLVVELGVMVKDNYWKFESSLWEAAQRLHDQHQQSQRFEQHDRAKTDGIPSVGTAGGVTGPRFQDTDLPHPGWEDIISTQSNKHPLPVPSHSTLLSPTPHASLLSSTSHTSLLSTPSHSSVSNDNMGIELKLLS